MKTRHCKSRDDVKEAGDYWINRSDPEYPTILIFLPKDTYPAYLRLYQLPVYMAGDAEEEGGVDTHYWTLTGPDECPTLTPSLDRPGVWHGHLTNGELTEA